MNQVLTQSFCKWGNVPSNNNRNNSVITLIALSIIMTILQWGNCSFQMIQGESAGTAASCHRTQRVWCSRCFLKDVWCILGGSRYESQNVHLRMFGGKKRLLNGTEPTVSLRLCISRRGSPRPRRDFSNFKHTPADPVSLCGHFTYSALRRSERLVWYFRSFNLLPKAALRPYKGDRLLNRDSRRWTGHYPARHSVELLKLH